jgi:hypothetical protein
LLEIPEREPAGELYQVLATQLERGIAPHVQDAFAKATTEGAARIARYLERRHLHGAQADALEHAGIDALLGTRHRDLASARLAMKHALEQMPPGREPEVLRHLWGVARRNMQLMEPLVARWRECRLAQLD